MRWRKIEDEKPSIDELILALTTGDNIVSGRYFCAVNSNGRYTVERDTVVVKKNDYILSFDIDRWMPIKEFENAVGGIDTVYSDLYVHREYYSKRTGYPPDYERRIAHTIADELIKKKKIKFTTTKNDGRHNGVLAIRGELTVVDPQRES